MQGSIRTYRALAATVRPYPPYVGWGARGAERRSAKHGTTSISGVVQHGLVVTFVHLSRLPFRFYAIIHCLLVTPEYGILNRGDCGQMPTHVHRCARGTVLGTVPSHVVANRIILELGHVGAFGLPPGC